jgi:hypothetical protein
MVAIINIGGHRWLLVSGFSFPSHSHLIIYWFILRIDNRACAIELGGSLTNMASYYYNGNIAGDNNDDEMNR